MDGPANKGHTCVKGRFAHQFARSRDRLTAPLVRESGGFRLASWEEAIARITDAFGRIKAEHGPDAIAGLASSRATNEDCYVMQRLMRAAIGTHNIDNCSRVCHSPTSFALRKSFGLSGRHRLVRRHRGGRGRAPDRRRTRPRATRWSAPRIKQAALKGLKLVTADPRRIELADYGQLHLGIRPGTNAALLNGLAHVVIRDGLVDRAFIAERTEGYEAVAELVAAYTPEDVEEITGVPAADIERAAHLYAEAERACILWGLGVTEHRYGSEVRPADLQPRAADRQRRAAGRGAAAAARPEQRPGLLRRSARCPTPSPTTGRSPTSRRSRVVRAALGRRDEARARPEDAEDVRRGRRRLAEGDVDLRR